MDNVSVAERVFEIEVMPAVVGPAVLNQAIV